MDLTPEDITKRVKITNLFRLAKRIDQSQSKELFLQFEKNLKDQKPLASSLESKQLEETYERLKKKFLVVKSSDSQELFGV